MKFLTVFFTVILLATCALALERKDVAKISADELADETQLTMDTGDSRLDMVWWIPFEFWDVVLSSDASLSAQELRDVRASLRPYAVVAAVQADISALGAFHFYDEARVADNLTVVFEDSKGTPTTLTFEENLNPDLELLLETMKPGLAAAMGNLGSNFHFFACRNRSTSGSQLIDPYQKGTLTLSLRQPDGTMAKAVIEMPLNSLYVPRKCANGKDAHISWKYCPWTGEKLPE